MLLSLILDICATMQPSYCISQKLVLEMVVVYKSHSIKQTSNASIFLKVSNISPMRRSKSPRYRAIVPSSLRMRYATAWSDVDAMLPKRQSQSKAAKCIIAACCLSLSYHHRTPSYSTKSRKRYCIIHSFIDIIIIAIKASSPVSRADPQGTAAHAHL